MPPAGGNLSATLPKSQIEPFDKVVRRCTQLLSGLTTLSKAISHGSSARLPEVHYAESEMGVKNTSKQSHRTCVRMSAKDYELLKKKSAAAGLSANAWLMAQLETNRPVLHREEETWETIRFMDEAGREINVIARDFNSGYGTAEQLRHAVHLLGAVYERLYALRKKGYLHAA